MKNIYYLGILLSLSILLLSCTSIQEQQSNVKNIVVVSSNCDTYSNDKIHKIKYDFWDVDTNKKIERCLQTSNNIEFRDITNDAFTQKYPSVFGNYVVWEDYRNGKSDVYLYDINTKETKQITSYEVEDFKPTIKDGLIIFHKQYGGDLIYPTPKDKNDGSYWRSGLFMYDILNNKFIQLSNFNENLGIVPKGNFDGKFAITQEGLIYDVSDKVNRDQERLVGLKELGTSNPSYPVEENGAVKMVSTANDNPVIRMKIKFIPESIQKFRKRNWNPPSSVGGEMIIDDPTPPNIKRICNTGVCNGLKGDISRIDCLHSEKLCNIDTTIFDQNVGKGNYLQDGYIIGGPTILRIDNGDYYTINLPYKQVKGNYVLEYKLGWGLKNLAIIDLSKKPYFYDDNVPKEISSKFGKTMELLPICLEIKNNRCIKIRSYIRIYDFEKDKYYTIKGNLENDGVIIDKGSFDIDFGKAGYGEESIFPSVYNIHSQEEIDFDNNVMVWTNKNEKIVNGVSNYNTDIKLAIIN